MWNPIKVLLVFMVLLIAPTVQAADCQKALFGWDTSSGYHVQGVLANEGVTKKNPRGYQNLARDRGNFYKGENCGGTAYGLACASFPGIDMKTVTKARAVKIYHDDQWRWLHGDEIISQYLAYKVLDLEINMGPKTAVILLAQTINDLNGKAIDFQLNGKVSAEMIRWINNFTAPQILADGTESHYRRWMFFEHLKGVALMRYGTLIVKNPNLSEFWDTWRYRAEYDR